MSATAPAKASASDLASYAWVILFVAWLASVAATLNQFKVPPLIPVLSESLGLNLSQAGLLMSVYAITGLILALPAGLVLQNLGPKLAGLIALACLAVGAAWGALSGSFGMLLGSRVLEGVGMGLIAVVGPAAIAIWFPPESRGTPMGIWATWVPVGSVVMFNLAPALQASYGWQGVWWVGAGFALVSLLLYWAFMRMPALPGVVRNGERVELPDDTPPSFAAALANRSIWLLGLEFACFNVVTIAILTFFPTYLVAVRGYSLAQAAFITSLTTLVALVSTPLSGWLSDRIGSRRWLIVVPFLFVAGLMLVAFQVSGASLYVFVVLLGLFAGAIPAATFAAAPEVMGGPLLAGIGLGVVSLGTNLGVLLGPVLVGWLVESNGWGSVPYLLVPVALLGVLAGWLVKVR